MRYLTYQFILKPNSITSFAIDLMCLNASKLWNIANYERKEYLKLGFEVMPDWFDQKKRLKTDYHYKMMLAQSAQDLLKEVDSAWKSYRTLLLKGMVANEPHYKKVGQHTCVTFAHHSFKRIGKNIVRFSIPKAIKTVIKDKYKRDVDFFYITLKRDFNLIKTFSFHHVKPGEFKVCISYEQKEPIIKKENGRHIGIDLGVTNLFAVYDNNGSSFIINGSSFKNTIFYFSKKISHYQKILRKSFGGNKEKAFKSKRISSLYVKRRKRIEYLIHASTKYIVDYCVKNDVSKVIIGDMKFIKKHCDFGHVSRQQFYSLSFSKIVNTLEYKLKSHGIELIKVNEAYSSQCPPNSKEVSKQFRLKNRRKKRGLYKFNKKAYNSDSLGAFNILRIYYQQHQITNQKLDYRCISNPSNICIPVTLNFFDYFPCWKSNVGVAGRDYPSHEQIMSILSSLSCSAEA